MDMLDNLRRCARPVVFETDNDDAPCSTAGTAFIVGFQKSLYVIVPRHVVREWPIEKLRIYPSWNSPYSFRYLNWWFIETQIADPDTSDIVIIKVAFDDVPKDVKRDTQLLNLNNRENVVWYDERYDSQFFLCGFPTSRSEVDYSTLEINTYQFFLEGVYNGIGPSSWCHTIELKNPLRLDDFNGLSGSPVFSHRIANTAGTPGRFCGMVLRGTATSGFIHFLAVEMLMSALSQVESTN